MSRSWSKFAAVLLALSVSAIGLTSPALAQKAGVRKLQKKKPDLLPAYTPGPLLPMPLDQVPAVAPKVNFQDGQLTIQAHNSTLADVLREIRKQTGSDFDVPSNATERVVADIGPGPARDILTELLNGTHFNYVIVGSLTDPTAVQNVILTPKTTGPETASAAPPTPGIPQPMPRSGVLAAQIAASDSNDDNSDSTDDSDQADAQEEPPQQQADQQNQAPQPPKTPEQLLQELQRQQQQLQQQQQSGQQPPNGQAAPNGQPQPGLFPNLPPTSQPSPTKPD